MRRLVLRAVGRGNEALACEANGWLMHTMSENADAYACRSSRFMKTIVFGNFKRLSAWERLACEKTQAYLARQFVDRLPSNGLPSNRHARLQQKLEEMELADLVLVPSSYVAKTARTFHPNKSLALAPYGVDLDF